MKKGLYALSFGTFGLGIAEYIMMGILPDVASDFVISLPVAGHLISAYALGVCVGAPLVAIIARNWPLKRILFALVGCFIAGCLITMASPSYSFALVGRFITGIPHGSFFGVGSIVASKLSKEGKSTSAIATMVMGMSIANLLGIPIANWISHTFSWRWIFIFAAVWGGITISTIGKWIPALPPMPKTNIKGMFLFLKKPEPWLLIAATVLGNGGIFCWYSYINPMMTQVSGFDVSAMPLLMFLAGGSMCVGNYGGGKMSDKFTPGIVAMYTQFIIFASLMALFFWGRFGFTSALLMCVCTGCLFAVSSPQQMLLLQYSSGGEMMGGAMVQLAFNLGNALGAYFGGLPIATGAGVEYSALIGAVFAFTGTGVLVLFHYLSGHGRTPSVPLVFIKKIVE